MRLSSAEAQLSQLDEKDRNLVRLMAHARGHFTLSDYAGFRGVSRGGAHRRLQGHAGSFYRRLRPSAANSFPEIYYLERKFAHPFNPDYQEPKTFHTLLDGLLRTRVALNRTGEWSHHVRQPAVFVCKDGVHVVDCLDRTPSAILNFALDLKPEKQVIKIHTGQSHRVAAIEYLQKRQVEKSSSKLESEDNLTWDNLFGERKRQLQTTDKELKSPSIEIVYHDLQAFRFGEVC